MANPFDQASTNQTGGVAIIAPAGYGKTECIADFAQGQQLPSLVLTHTNAGVTALKRRFSSKGVKNGTRITTIAAWCEAWVTAYPTITKFGTYAALQENKPDDYFRHLYVGMLELSKKAWFRNTIRLSYGSVVVDEYQDCTLTQHALFLQIAEFMPLVVLGDPLQGVFYWVKDDSIVDWNNLGFPIQPLDSRPWRWINADCPDLGEYIHAIRDELMPALEGRDVKTCINRGCPNVVIVTPDEIRSMQNWQGYGSVVYITNVTHAQHSFSQYHRRFQSNEAIENSDAIEACKSFDEATGAKLALAVLDFAEKCNTKVAGELKSYRKNLEKGGFNFSRIKKHQDVGTALMAFERSRAANCILSALIAIRRISGARLYRGVLYNEVIRALKTASQEGLSISDALSRNRAQGRSFEEHTPYQLLSSRTVLSKGLEFDTAIVDAVSIKDARDFYVAISRCKRRLIIVSGSDILTFKGIAFNRN